MKNITFEGISTLQRQRLCWYIRKQIGRIHQPIKVEFHQPICHKQYSSLWYGGLVVSIKVSGCVFAIHACGDKTDCAADYPGVFIDYVRKDGATAILACVEYDPNKEALQTVVYGNCASDEPTEIVEHYNTDFEE